MKLKYRLMTIRRLGLSTIKSGGNRALITYSVLIAAVLWIFVWPISVPVAASRASGGKSTPLQSQLVPIGILYFQDESGINTPPELGQKIANELRQKLVVNYKDVLPRMLNAGVDLPAVASMNVEQVVA